jgi:hypothetical protein
MTSDRPRLLTGIFLGAAIATFSLAVTLNPAAAMPTTAATVHAAQAGLSQVQKTQATIINPHRHGPGWGWRRPGFRRNRVCFWRFGRRICTWR